MRVAYLLASFPNTSETFILNEIAEAQRQGIEVRIFSLLKPNGECHHATARSLMSKVEYLPEVKKPGLLKGLLFHLYFVFKYHYHYLSALLFTLKQKQQNPIIFWTFKISVIYAYHILKFKPHLIHTHFAYDSCRLTMLISKIIGIPYTLTIHGWGDLYHHPPSDLRTIMLNTKKTITVCEYNLNYILDTYQIPKDRITIIRCGIPTEFFSSAISYDKRIPGLIISVGRLHYHKAFHILIAACKLLADRHVPFLCQIIGDGDLRKDLQEQIESSHLESRVQLIGARSYEQVREIMCKAEIFAMSSAVETVGLAVVEALASEVPVVATRVYGVPEMVVDDETGFLCEPGNPVCIADHLEKLLCQDDLRKYMGSKGRLRALKKHGLPVQVAKLIELWRS